MKKSSVSLKCEDFLLLSVFFFAVNLGLGEVLKDIFFIHIKHQSIFFCWSLLIIFFIVLYLLLVAFHNHLRRGGYAFTRVCSLLFCLSVDLLICLFVCVHYSLNPDLFLNIPSFVELHLTHLKRDARLFSADTITVNYLTVTADAEKITDNRN